MTMFSPLVPKLPSHSFLVIAVSVVLALFHISSARAADDGPQFVAAYYHPYGVGALLTVFPPGLTKALDISLPFPMSSLILLSFGPDARSAYFISPPFGGPDGVTKLEFGPTRKSIVEGSVGLTVAFLTVSGSGRIFVIATDMKTHKCGAYEIDPDNATHRPMRVGGEPGCKGFRGPISPDGTSLLSRDDDHLSLLDLGTGARTALGTGLGSWSPDGRWIAVAGDGKIVLIDAKNPSYRRKLGRSGTADRLIWSPDSKRILLAKQERGCFLQDDYESLEVLDVETGERHVIPSSDCAVTSSAIGWVDSEAVGLKGSN